MSASVNYNDKRKSKDFALQDAEYGFVESKREQVRLQEELSVKETVLRNTQIRSMQRTSSLCGPRLAGHETALSDSSNDSSVQDRLCTWA